MNETKEYQDKYGRTWPDAFASVASVAMFFGTVCWVSWLFLR